MEEEIKTIRTMREFVRWYEDIEAQGVVLPANFALTFNSFNKKFKYILQQELEENNRMKKFLEQTDSEVWAEKKDKA